MATGLSLLQNLVCLFRGARSSYELLGLDTPQGGVLSSFPFNGLLYRLPSLLPATTGTIVTCYANDICIHWTSSHDFQLYLHDFQTFSTACGLIISQEKSRIFSSRNFRTLPPFTMGRNTIPHCTQCIYLQAPVRITPATPARKRVHPVVKKKFLTICRLALPLSNDLPPMPQVSPSLC